MYTQEMLLKRDQLRHDPMVQSALDAAWERLGAARDFGDVIPWSGYQAMCRKLYLLFKIQRRESYLESADALSEIERDWPVDSNKKEHMTKEDFGACFFQLADVHTDNVKARSYAALIQTAAAGIATADGKWVDDRTLLRQLRQRCMEGKGFDNTSFGADVRQWAESFGVSGLAAAMGYAPRSTSARGSRRGSVDGAWGALAHNVKTRGADEWDPAVNFMAFLSQRGSAAPPPRVDKPAPRSRPSSASTLASGSDAGGVMQIEAGTSATDSQLPSPHSQRRRSSNGHGRRERRASESELQLVRFGLLNSRPQMSVSMRSSGVGGSASTSDLPSATTDTHSTRSQHTPFARPPAIRDPEDGVEELASSLGASPRRGPLGAAYGLGRPLETIPQSPSPRKFGGGLSPSLPSLGKMRSPSPISHQRNASLAVGTQEKPAVADDAPAAADGSPAPAIAAHAPAAADQPAATEVAVVTVAELLAVTAEVAGGDPAGAPQVPPTAPQHHLPKRQLRPALPLSPGVGRSNSVSHDVLPRIVGNAFVPSEPVDSEPVDSEPVSPSEATRLDAATKMQASARGRAVRRGRETSDAEAATSSSEDDVSVDATAGAVVPALGAEGALQSDGRKAKYVSPQKARRESLSILGGSQKVAEPSAKALAMPRLPPPPAFSFDEADEEEEEEEAADPDAHATILVSPTSGNARLTVSLAPAAATSVPAAVSAVPSRVEASGVQVQSRELDEAATAMQAAARGRAARQRAACATVDPRTAAQQASAKVQARAAAQVAEAQARAAEAEQRAVAAAKVQSIARGRLVRGNDKRPSKLMTTDGASPEESLSASPTAAPHASPSALPLPPFNSRTQTPVSPSRHVLTPVARTGSAGAEAALAPSTAAVEQHGRNMASLAPAAVMADDDTHWNVLQNLADTRTPQRLNTPMARKATPSLNPSAPPQPLHGRRPILPVSHQLASGKLRSALRPLNDEIARTGRLTPPPSKLAPRPTSPPKSPDAMHIEPSIAAHATPQQGLLWPQGSLWVSTHPSVERYGARMMPQFHIPAPAPSGVAARSTVERRPRTAMAACSMTPAVNTAAASSCAYKTACPPPDVLTLSPWDEGGGERGVSSKPGRIRQASPRPGSGQSKKPAPLEARANQNPLSRSLPPGNHANAHRGHIFTPGGARGIPTASGHRPSTSGGHVMLATDAVDAKAKGTHNYTPTGYLHPVPLMHAPPSAADGWAPPVKFKGGGATTRPRTAASTPAVESAVARTFAAPPPHAALRTTHFDAYVLPLPVSAKLGGMSAFSKMHPRREQELGRGALAPSDPTSLDPPPMPALLMVREEVVRADASPEPILGRLSRPGTANNRQASPAPPMLTAMPTTANSLGLTTVYTPRAIREQQKRLGTGTVGSTARPTSAGVSLQGPFVARDLVWAQTAAATTGVEQGGAKTGGK